ncbi:MAG: hypothetical protein J6S53_07445 [Lentisphaeria bacterium]|nr:hypothetical protein [Lentisphaeria bacterium]
MVKTPDDPLAGKIYLLAHDSYARLGKYKEQSSLLDFVMQHFPENLSVLENMSPGFSYGYILDGKIVRGYPRGVRAEGVHLQEYDRIRILQHLYKAKKKFDNTPPVTKGKYYSLLAKYLKKDRGETWKYRNLTSLTIFPSYDKISSYSFSPPPVNKAGEPLLYKIPVSFENAVNDGERLRYCWEIMQHAPVNSSIYKEGKLFFADFLYKEFDFSFLDEELKREYCNYEENMEKLRSLKENESICRLASGVKKITLPEEYNYIRLFRESENFLLLARIFSSRLQLEKAVQYYRKALKKNPGNKNILNEIKNITGNSGMLLPVKMSVEGEEAAIKLIYRNAESASVTVRKLDWKKLYDIFLSKRSLAGERVPNNLYSFMDHSYFTNNRNQYLRNTSPWKELAEGSRIDSFEWKLNPRKGHINTGVKIPLDKIKKAGVYLVTVKLKEGTVCETLYCVTKGLLLSGNTPDGTRILFCNAKTGEALPGKKIFFHTYRYIYARNPREVKEFGGRSKILSGKKEFVTDKDGSFIIPYEKNFASSFLVSFDEEYPLFMRVHNVNGSFRISSFPERRKVFFITDRPIYKPGDTVYFTGYIRTPSYSPETKEKVPGKYLVSIRGARNTKLYEKTLVPDEKNGSFSDSVKIPEDAPLGTYRIYGKNGLITFRVEEFKKKDYELKISTDPSIVENGGKIRFVLQGKYYTGDPMRDAKISYKIYRKEKFFSFPLSAPYDFLYGKGYFYCGKRWMPAIAPVHWANSGNELVMEGVVQGDNEGKGAVTVPEKITKRFAGKDSLYTIKAEIRDASYSIVTASASVTISNNKFHVYILCGRGFYAPGEIITPKVSVYSPDGEKVENGFVIYSLYTRKMGNDHLPVKGKLLKKAKFPLTEENFVFSLTESASYLLEAEVITPKGKQTASHVIFVRGMEKKNEKNKEELFTEYPLEIIRDKECYAPGENVQILLSSNKENGTFYLFRHPERENNMEKIFMPGKSTVVEMPITEKDYPNTFFEVITIREGKVYREKMNIPVPPEKKRMDIQLRPPEKTVQPGKILPVEILLQDAKGFPVQGVFTLAVYDRKLEQFSSGNTANIFSFFWGWKRQFFSRMENVMTSYIPVHKGSFIPNIHPFWTLWFLPEKNCNGLSNKGIPEGENHDMESMGHAEAVSLRIMNSSAPAMAAFRRKEKMDASGGPSEENRGGSINIRENFVDSLLWIGRKEVGKDGKAVVYIPVSDDLTAWHIRVWGLTSDNRVGEAKTEFTVRKDLMCRLTLPRFLINGDESTLVAHFHNLTDKEMKTTFSLQSNTAFVSLAGKGEKGTFLLPANGYKKISFPIKAMQTGEGSFTLKAWDSISRKSDALLLKLPVLVKGSPKTILYGGSVDKKTKTKTVSFSVPEKRRKDSLFLTLDLASSIAAPAMRLLPFLAAEKSKNVFAVVSKYIPAVAAKKVLDILKLSFDDLSFAPTNLDPLWKEYLWKNDVVVYTENLFRKNLADGEKMLCAMQNSDGGWGWFGGNFEQSYPDTTAEAVEALWILKEYKKEKKDPALEKGLKYLEKYMENRLIAINRKKALPSDTDALVLKVMTQCGRSVPPMEEKLLEKKNILSPYALALLGKTLKKNSPQRKEILRNLYQFLEENKENGTAYLAVPVSFSCFWYGNENMTNSAFLSLLLDEEPSSPLCTALARYLAVNIQYSPWRNSTRSLGKVLQSLGEYMLKNQEINVEMDIRIVLNGKEWKKVKTDRKNIWKGISFSMEEKSPEGKKFLHEGVNTLSISYTGKGSLLYHFALSCFSLEDKITSSGKELKLKRNYYKKIPVKSSSFMVDGKGAPVKVNEEKFIRKKLSAGEFIQVGDIVEVELITESGNDYDYVSLKDPLPAGFEYVKSVSGYKWDSFVPVYCEYGKSSADFFLRNLARGKGNISYEIRAQLPGIYTALPATGKGEYAPLLRANTESFINIIKAKQD